MNPVHVAVGVVLDADKRVLLSRRAAGSHQGGLWEFPGGKLEPGESVESALGRELHEELGIVIGPTTPLLQVPHKYSDKSVLLDVWLVREFTGTARGCEGQPLVWASAGQLHGYRFPEANIPIVAAVKALLQS